LDQIAERVVDIARRLASNRLRRELTVSSVGIRGGAIGQESILIVIRGRDRRTAAIGLALGSQTVAVGVVDIVRYYSSSVMTVAS
jgi:hypothetical protein